MPHRLLCCILFLLVSNFGYTQNQITTQNNKILDACGEEIVLKGVNYAPFNWGYSPWQLWINQIEKTGANAVRLVWFTDLDPTANQVYQDTAKLDEAIRACIQNDMIPIIELHDQTCDHDTTSLIAMANWYLQPDVQTVLKRHEHSLIINLFNEALWIDWTGNIIAARYTFVNCYSTIIQNMRNAGYVAPLMIDAPDCGKNLVQVTDLAQNLINADPEQNLIFSAHSYWHDYANLPSQMDNLINIAVSKNIPFVIGEMANYQDWNSPCQYSLNYQYLAGLCESKNIGWLAWSWDQDNCNARQMTLNGQFSALTVFGNTLVNDPNFGMLTNPAARSTYLLTDGSCNSTPIQENSEQVNVLFSPQPVSELLIIEAPSSNYQVEIIDITGKIVDQSISNNTSQIQLPVNNLPIGIYVVRLIDQRNEIEYLHKMVKK